MRPFDATQHYSVIASPIETDDSLADVHQDDEISLVEVDGSTADLYQGDNISTVEIDDWATDLHQDAKSSIADSLLDVAKQASSISLQKDRSSDGNNLDEESKKKLKTHKGFPRFRPGSNLSGWRTGVAANIVFVAIIFIFNIVFVIWARARRRQGNIVFQNDCKRTGTWMLAAHGIINVLGSIALGSSNYAMQVLLSPTREEVNRAHSKRKWVYIGGQSFGNFRHISSIRIFLWVLLAVSSIPFHLMYNSVIYQVTGANSYYSIIASPNFLNGTPYNMTLVQNASIGSTDAGQFGSQLSNDSFLPVLNDLFDKAINGSLQNLSFSECAGAYGSNIQDNFRNVFIITNDSLANHSLFGYSFFSPAYESPGTWTCTNNFTYPSPTYPCSTGEVIKTAGSLVLWNSSDWNDIYSGQLQKNVSVSYCLAEEYSSSQCSLEFNFNLMAFILSANLTKLGCMILLLWRYNEPTFVTIGDAVASFLESPDPNTRGYAVATMRFNGQSRNREEYTSWLNTLGRLSHPEKRVTRNRARNRLHKMKPETWFQTPEGRQYRPKLWSDSWFSAVSDSTLMVSFSFYIAIFASAAVILLLNVLRLKGEGLGTSFTDISSMGFGQVRTDSVVSIPLPSGISSLVLLANIPQLLLSIGYLLLNRIVTAMVTSREWALFAHQRKGLRVTRPSGSQRNTYWLQLPMRYSMPLLLISIFLHYVVSQGFFLVVLDVAAAYGENVSSQRVATLGYSVIAQIAALILSFVVILSGIILGFIRNKPGIPPARNCSAMISAACHPPLWDRGASRKKVQWGDVGRLWEQLWEEMEAGYLNNFENFASVARHCCFSSEKVDLPREGEIYL